MIDKMEREIGEAAGKIWEALHSNGSMSNSRIARHTRLSGRLTDRAIGWLAREGKIVRERKKRSEMIRLKE